MPTMEAEAGPQCVHAACKLLIADYDWSVYKRVIDIGGCYGSLMAALMVHVPSLQGVLFDQPQVNDGELFK